MQELREKVDQLERISIIKSNEIERELNLTGDGSVRILSLDASITEAKADARDGSVLYGGILTVSCLFLAGETERREVAAKFSFRAPIDGGVEEKADVFYRVDNAEIKNEGGMLSVKVAFTAEITAFKKLESEVLTETPVLSKKGEITFDGEARSYGRVEVEDEFEIRRIRKILSTSARATVTGAQCGVGCIVADGEATVTLVMLAAGDSGELLRETRIIPFRYELEATDADVSNECYAFATAGKISARAEVDEDRDRTTVTTTLEIAVEGGVFTRKTLVCVEDAYSPDYNLEAVKAQITPESFGGFFTGNERINGRAECDVPEYSRFLTLAGERLEITDSSFEGGINVEGILVADAIFADGENELRSVKARLPFSFSIPVSGGEVERFVVDAGEISCRLRNGGLEVDATLKTCYYTKEKRRLSVATEIRIGDKKPEDESSFAVYIGRKGDEEWDVVRLLGVDAEKLLELNPEISFPLSGGERIICFKQ